MILRTESGKKNKLRKATAVAAFEKNVAHLDSLHSDVDNNDYDENPSEKSNESKH